MFKGYVKNFLQEVSIKGFDLEKEKRDIREANIYGWTFLSLTTLIAYFFGVLDQYVFWVYLAFIMLYSLLYYCFYFIVAGQNNPTTRGWLSRILVFVFLIGGLIPLNTIPYEKKYIMGLYFLCFIVMFYQIIPITNIRIYLKNKPVTFPYK